MVDYEINYNNGDVTKREPHPVKAEIQASPEVEEQLKGVRAIEYYLSKDYDFRYNVILGAIEYRAKNIEVFEPISDRVLSSFMRMLAYKGVKTSTTFIYDLLQSTFSPECNPIQEFILNTPLTKKGEIFKLSRTVTPENTENWYPYLWRWFIASVANVFTLEGCQNHTCLTLLGAEGKGKTTWLDNLCPAPLQANYLYTGKFYPDNKDHLLLLATSFIINIDDHLHSINKQDEDAIKTIITAPRVTARRAYARVTQTYPRIANFVASVNRPDFLHEPNGGRRFLPFNLLDIDLKAMKEVDIAQCWAEAYDAFKKGEKYHFEGKELEALMLANQSFRVVSMEFEQLQKLIRKPKLDEKGEIFISEKPYIKYMTCSDLVLKLQQKGLKATAKKVGIAMKDLGIALEQKTLGGERVRVYQVIETTFEEQEELQKFKEMPADGEPTTPENLPSQDEAVPF